ncbi:hypothetical protein SAMN04487944_1263 [Gracilibacillus ureilyticus]|uniref:Spore coat protein W n=1 Tax=Gracilibacillus ureilyticus TaxID=531814 RepID=A0A1H9VPW5_9BACI|nr:hypothetical protein [Gracilibacillus ureilyticus]SES23619.1 hypothetical protein SAMN04487944_1263 [Gracilibacillus ureilyticus]
MVSNSDFKDTSEKIIDLLVGTTLKRHNIQLDSRNLSAEDREQLKSLVNELKRSVQSLSERNNNSENSN